MLQVFNRGSRPRLIVSDPEGPSRVRGGAGSPRGCHIDANTGGEAASLGFHSLSVSLCGRAERICLWSGLPLSWGEMRAAGWPFKET